MAGLLATWKKKKLIMTITETTGVKASRYLREHLGCGLLPALLVGSLGDGYRFTLFLQLLQPLLPGSNPAAGHQSHKS